MIYNEVSLLVLVIISKICVCAGEYDNHTPSSLALVAVCVDAYGGGGDRGYDRGGYDREHDFHQRDDDEDACDTSTETIQNRYLQMILHLQTP